MKTLYNGFLIAIVCFTLIGIAKCVQTNDFQDARISAVQSTGHAVAVAGAQAVGRASK